jgi:hypothetical protein
MLSRLNVEYIPRSEIHITYLSEINISLYFTGNHILLGHAVAFKALCYKPEGRGFDSR